MIGGLKCTHEKLSGHQKLKADGRVTLSTTLLAENPVGLSGFVLRKANIPASFIEITRFLGKLQMIQIRVVNGHKINLFYLYI